MTVRKPKKKQYCCDHFKYLVNTGMMENFDGMWMRMCADCERHNGYPEKYCGECGKNLLPAPNPPKDTNTVTIDGRNIDGLE